MGLLLVIVMLGLKQEILHSFCGISYFFWFPDLAKGNVSDWLEMENKSSVNFVFYKFQIPLLRNRRVDSNHCRFILLFAIFGIFYFRYLYICVIIKKNEWNSLSLNVLTFAYVQKRFDLRDVKWHAKTKWCARGSESV